MWLNYVISPLIKKCQKDVRLRGNFRGGGGGLNLTFPPLLPINFTAFTADLTQF